MRLVWVTGVSGSGKSTVCALLKSRGVAALDADWEGFNQWVERATGAVVIDPPYPTPPNWLDLHDWHIRPDLVRALHDSGPGVTYLFGAVANEHEVWELFDRVGCLIVDDTTLRQRLATRTTNAFGKHAKDLAHVLKWNATHASSYRDVGATIIDATRPVGEVAEAVVMLGDGLE